MLQTADKMGRGRISGGSSRVESCVGGCSLKIFEALKQFNYLYDDDDDAFKINFHRAQVPIRTF